MELTIREVAPRDQIRARLAEFEKTVMKASYSAFMAPELVELLAEGRVVVPWLSTLLLVLGASLAILALFVIRERRTARPLLPLRIVLDRNRGGA